MESITQEISLKTRSTKNETESDALNITHLSGNIYFSDEPVIDFSDKTRASHQINSYMNGLGKITEDKNNTTKIAIVLAVGHTVNTKEFDKTFKELKNASIHEAMDSFHSPRNVTYEKSAFKALTKSTTDMTPLDKDVYENKDSRAIHASEINQVKFYSTPADPLHAAVLQRVWLLSQIQPIAIQASNENSAVADRIALTFLIANQWINVGWSASRGDVIEALSHTTKNADDLINRLSDEVINQAFNDAFQIYKTTPHYNRNLTGNNIDITPLLNQKAEDVNEKGEITPVKVSPITKYVMEKAKAHHGNTTLTFAQKRGLIIAGDFKTERMDKVDKTFYLERTKEKKALVKPLTLAKGMLATEAALSDAVLYTERKGWFTREQGDAVGALKELNDGLEVIFKDVPKTDVEQTLDTQLYSRHGNPLKRPAPTKPPVDYTVNYGDEVARKALITSATWGVRGDLSSVTADQGTRGRQTELARITALIQELEKKDDLNAEQIQHLTKLRKEKEQLEKQQQQPAPAADRFGPLMQELQRGTGTTTSTSTTSSSNAPAQPRANRPVPPPPSGKPLQQVIIELYGKAKLQSETSTHYLVFNTAKDAEDFSLALFKANIKDTSGYLMADDEKSFAVALTEVELKNVEEMTKQAQAKSHLPIPERAVPPLPRSSQSTATASKQNQSQVDEEAQAKQAEQQRQIAEELKRQQEKQQRQAEEARRQQEEAQRKQQEDLQRQAQVKTEPEISLQFVLESPTGTSSTTTTATSQNQQDQATQNDTQTAVKVIASASGPALLSPPKSTGISTPTTSPSVLSPSGNGKKGRKSVKR